MRCTQCAPPLVYCADHRCVRLSLSLVVIPVTMLTLPTPLSEDKKTSTLPQNTYFFQLPFIRKWPLNLHLLQGIEEAQHNTIVKREIVTPVQRT